MSLRCANKPIEYITQLEAEIAGKVNENGDLRAQNRALVEENKRLSDLTRMLLASPSFSNFLDHLSANPSQAQAPQVKVEPQQEQQRQSMPKDTNPYGSVPSQQQIGMAMIPEQTMDFSMLSLDNSYNFQPQVFVVDALEIPAPMDASTLSGKSTNFAEPLAELDEEKMEVPALNRAVERTEPVEGNTAPLDEAFESDPEYALYHSEPTTPTERRSELDTEGLSNIDIFGGIEAEKVLARYELLDASDEEMSAAISMARVQRISDNIEGVVSRLELLTMDL
jgi:regulator of replication initiation timing